MVNCRCGCQQESLQWGSLSLPVSPRCKESITKEPVIENNHFSEDFMEINYCIKQRKRQKTSQEARLFIEHVAVHASSTRQNQNCVAVVGSAEIWVTAVGQKLQHKCLMYVHNTWVHRAQRIRREDCEIGETLDQKKKFMQRWSSIKR